MFNESVTPPAIMRSVYCPEPGQRAATLQEIVSLEVKELFPDSVPQIYSLGDDIGIIRKAAEEALADVDMSMIRSQDTVNILCSEHGFLILGGEPYAEMIRVVRDVVQRETGCENIRLRVGSGIGAREGDEIIEQYGFDSTFKGHAVGIGPLDKGVPIETEIGTLYGVARAYDADWFIHCHYNDLRELYWHRQINRALKPFAMSYARMETRGVYHFNFGPRSSNFVQKAVFNAPFVQQRYAFTCFLMSSPMGITGIDADNDLYRLDRRLTVGNLRNYGKMLRLFAEIDECIPVLDAGKWPAYQHAGGMIFGNLVNAKLDYFDLDTVPAGTGFALFEKEPGAPKVKAVNSAIKALVINHMWINMMCTELAMSAPTIIVGRDLADMLITDSSNPMFMNFAVTAENLDTAVNYARRIAGTDKLLIFDGSHGSINLSQPLGEFLLKRAPEVSREVDEVLLPKWLRQRGIDPEQT
jgi:hypothetical protein